MTSPITSEVPEKEGNAWLADEPPRVKQDDDDDDNDDDDEHGDERGGDGENKPAEHTTINVTNRSEGNIKDDCSDITDNHETEEQSSRTFPQKVSSVFDKAKLTRVERRSAWCLAMSWRRGCHVIQQLVAEFGPRSDAH
jgi:hypothetical protein